MRRKESGKIMVRLLVSFIIAGLILFPGPGAVNGEELFPGSQSPFFSVPPMFQDDVMALEMKQGENSLAELNAVSAMAGSAVVGTVPEDRWNEIRLSGLTLSISRHAQGKEHAYRRTNLTPENPYNLDDMLPLLLRGARRPGDIETLGGFISPYFNLRIAF
jgi:hypothetical protein